MADSCCFSRSTSAARAFLSPARRIVRHGTHILTGLGGDAPTILGRVSEQSGRFPLLPR
ncbi:hypothetical protein QLQ12_17590 [Actinoplanes sp. NEAU-A12]|uniref:Uncharacterized protein n=1 Tax=Actinoplanes sandaracinus TaxID=3045177 RepID=A0ABT6WL16_9ACTN|nr:hypothetical protein [Actinoplanes sandaracinus]MDI6100424.1 hypothetical protein [Actinoplanes sandaracinus]